MALATRRWLTMRFLTTTSAALNAASMSPPPSSHLKATLLGAPAWSWAAPAPTARSVAVIDGRTSQSTATFSAASVAASWLSAMTTATGSPTWRAASDDSGMWGTIERSCTTPGMFFSLRRSHPQGKEFTPVMSAPVNTATTPGCAFALDVSMLLIRACACGLLTNTA